jgi:mRNA interferase RelE/StbE
VTYQVKVTRSARRDLNRLGESVATAAVELIFGALAENPHRVGKALLGDLAGLHSARRGQYRVIYAIDDDTAIVTVICVAHRSDAYR